MDIHAAQRIARRFITLPLDKRRLYLEKMLQEGVSPANLPIPEVQSAVESIPLSFAQERQWFLWQLDPQSTAYNLPMVLRLRGNLDLLALQQCFNQLIARHESLRTRFVQRDEGVSQNILAEAPLDIPLTVLAPQADIEAAITGFVEAQTGQLFDLNEGPLLRVSLLQIDGQDHILTFVQHHIVSDGGSIQLMVNELVQLYDACQRGETLVLPALPIQYADYAIWQRHWMEAGERERQLAYWCEQLGDEQPVLALPTDRARPAEQSYRGARFEIALPHALSQRLRQLAQQEKATLFMVLLASFQAFLYRYSGQRDIRVGVPTANRNRVETEHLVGFFVNTQVLRAEVVGEQPFSVLLDQVRQAALGAQDHQDLPFEQLVEALHPQRSLSHAPLFQVMFNHQRMAAAGTGALALQLPGLSIEGVAWENRTAQFDLTLETYESDDGIAAALTYATDLFDALTIERLARHWQTLLQGIVEQPHARVGELPLLDVAEREQMVQDWNATSQPFGGLTHQVIAAQAERTPDAVALVCEQQQLTYRQLNQRANHLAHRLINMGVGPDALVGIAVERSVEMVVGLLAILKAGGAYVPLDTQYPADRLAYMLQDSGAQWLLTQAAVRDQLPIPPGVQVLVLSDTDETLQANPQVAVQPDNLAYVIYTSGSTGRPKGVSVRHRGLANHMAWMCKTLPLQSSDRILQKTAFSFDASVWEFWLPLMTGAQLVMAQPGLAESLSLLWEQVEAQRITVLQLAPSLLQALLPEASDAQLASLNVVLCGGEALSTELSRQLQQRWSGRLINLYGPTEATIDTSSHEVPVDPAGPIVAIGKPIDNVRTYVLSEAFEPCPPGAAGELYIGGDSLARGYHLRPGMTAERFIPDPFASRSGARLYRTGDLVRYRQDGVIDYIGRIDHQVKIRGLRIELGEIEARLLALDGVREAMVLAQGDAGAQVLVAYIIAAAGDLQPAPLREQIRAGLKANLPDYMVPAHLLFLEQWPLTVNGKLDRKALPLPDVSQAEHAHVAPQSELEQRIAVIWQDVLKRPSIGVTDNFFELGGDSIISIQVVSRARQAGIRFTPKELFQHQTVQGLAQVAQLAAGVVIDQSAVVGEAPLAPVQIAFFEQPVPDRARWNQSVMLTPRVTLDVALLEQALKHLVTHHDALRMAFTAQAQGWSARYQAPGEYSGALVREARNIDLEALEQWGDQAQGSLNLERGPLLRAVLANLNDGSQRLLVVIHHLVVDGISWRILFEDLQKAYQQLASGQRCVLPAKTSSFRAWVERLGQAATADTLRAQLDYWEGLLSGSSTALPVDHPHGSLSNRHAMTVHTQLDAQATRQLLQEAPAAYRTQVNDLLLSALARVIGRWTGQDSALIQLEGHGREDLFDDVDLTRTVGWFTSLFAVRLPVESDIAHSIKAVKEQLRAIPDKGIGYGVLRYLGDEPSRSRLQALPAPRITFNYLGQFDGSFDDEQALFAPSGEARGLEQSPEAALGNWLTLNGQVYGGELSLGWTFSGQMFDTSTVQRLADEYRLELLSVIAHCTAPGNSGLTPSDVPLAGLGQRQLDALPLALSAVEDIYPLSAMQQGMLFHTLYEQGGGDYINQMRLDVTGLDPERFRQAWQACVNSHEILRTGFLWQGDLERPLQVVHKHLELPFTVLDWQEHPALDGALDTLADADRQRGFDLVQAPLLRLTVVRTAPDQCHLIYTSHHILMDGWSNSQLLGEVLQRYSGQEPEHQPARYRDYIGWLQSQDQTLRAAFWTQQLAPLQAPTRLAQAVAAPLSADAGYASHFEVLDSRQTRLLNEFARQQKVTLNTLLQAAWLLLLQRYTGQSTVCFGATVAGRPADLKGVEQQIGLFINTLPVIASPLAGETVSHWLQTVQGQNLALREHEHTPLFEIQRWAEHGSESLFDTLLVFENYPISEALAQSADDGLSFGAVVAHEQSNYPLTLSVNAGQTLGLHYHYDRSQFAAGTMAGIARHLNQLLARFMAGSEQVLAQLATLEGDERRLVEHTWNANGLDFPRERCIHQQIQDQVQRTPDALAVIWGDEQLTYRQLNGRANALAHKLVALGVGPEVRVGVAMPRSAQMVVALLAVLKAGGAYVPLDPDYPAERVAYMLKDSQARVLLTQAAVALEVDASIDVLLVDAQEVDDQDLDVAVHAGNLAYVIYTSGSTGLPKGVAITHRNVAALTQWSQQVYSPEDIQGVLASTSICFDLSVWELFVTLAGGGFIVGARNALELPELAARDRVRLINSVPSAMGALQRAGQIPQSVRIINLAGEPLKQSLVDALYEHAHVQHVYDLYGPSEDTTYSTWTRREAGGQANIGRPLANTASYLLDAELHSVPVGVAAELYLAGEGITRGYLLRPGLTAEKFVPNPFSTTGDRLYRTGDLTRYRNDGVIEYVGRIDHQVKIRGLRIELGEIESRLLAHPGVR
ncbi:amino acid adenylation domain-containing protein, partial [Pseudomonas sp. 21615526]|uniref:non-ribosomal peptide synthetase n=2 Tax=Pseudomonas TaxID=286 RepID=UPI0015BA0446